MDLKDDKHSSVDEKRVEDSTPEAAIQDVAFWESHTAEERRLVRKFDSRILPLACLLYLFACELVVPITLRLRLILLAFSTQFSIDLTWGTRGCKACPRTLFTVILLVISTTGSTRRVYTLIMV